MRSDCPPRPASPLRSCCRAESAGQGLRAAPGATPPTRSATPPTRGAMTGSLVPDSSGTSWKLGTLPSELGVRDAGIPGSAAGAGCSPCRSGYSRRRDTRLNSRSRVSCRQSRVFETLRYPAPRLGLGVLPFALGILASRAPGFASRAGCPSVSTTGSGVSRRVDRRLETGVRASRTPGLASRAGVVFLLGSGAPPPSRVSRRLEDLAPRSAAEAEVLQRGATRTGGLSSPGGAAMWPASRRAAKSGMRCLMGFTP